MQAAFLEDLNFEFTIVDNLFSSELKDLVAKSRDTAIDMGYDYISTIHFFIADCESNKPGSIVKFGFSDEKEFIKFKTSYTLEKIDFLNMMNESLPLTKEAEKTILLTEAERILHRQRESYPCHFFLAALKNKESLLFECFKNDINAIDSLTKYYEGSGAFEKCIMSPEQISKEYYLPNQNSNISIAKKILKIFKGRE